MPKTCFALVPSPVVGAVMEGEKGEPCLLEEARGTVTVCASAGSPSLRDSLLTPLYALSLGESNNKMHYGEESDFGTLWEREKM